MKKLKLYVETSVWNFLFAEDAPDKRALTERLFEEIETGKYDIFISDVVEKELGNAPEEVENRLVGALKKYRPKMLEYSEESRGLVYYYIGNGLLSEEQLADLSHVALATENEIDILVSWNLKHIVRMKTKTMVNELNHLRGLRGIEICTPKEVLEYDR
ncbi:MAG: hypothetical protein AB1742_11110 [bacterium]